MHPACNRNLSHCCSSGAMQHGRKFKNMTYSRQQNPTIDMPSSFNTMVEIQKLLCIFHNVSYVGLQFPLLDKTPTLRFHYFVSLFVELYYSAGN